MGLFRRDRYHHDGYKYRRRSPLGFIGLLVLGYILAGGRLPMRENSQRQNGLPGAITAPNQQINGRGSAPSLGTARLLPNGKQVLEAGKGNADKLVPKPTPKKKEESLFEDFQDARPSDPGR